MLIKILFIFCSICCFLAFYRWSIEYYTFLRILVSIGAAFAIHRAFVRKRYVLAIVFALILIVFNPVFPLYLYNKSLWYTIDLIVGILFLLSLYNKSDKSFVERSEEPMRMKINTRDRVIIPKNLNKKIE